MIDVQVLNSFREYCCCNEYLINKYKNQNGRNLWSCICSALDWITVSTTYLCQNDGPVLSNIEDIASVNVYTYISCIDMIHESVLQLCRVFKLDFFEGEKRIFSNNYCKDDNSHFKLIRASFGAHPVNLKDYFTREEGEYFASWSTPHLPGGDFGIVLYNKQVGKKEIFFSIKFSELNMYLERTYNYLKTILKKIKEIEKEDRKKMFFAPIETSEDPYQQICILKLENERRNNNSYYNEVLAHLEIIYGTEITDARNLKDVEKYKKALQPAICQLQRQLQNMQSRSIRTYERLDKITYGYSHLLEKGFMEITNRATTNFCEPVVFESAAIEFLAQYIYINYDNSYKEKYLLMNAALYKKFLRDRKKD